MWNAGQQNTKKKQIKKKPQKEKTNNQT